MWKVVLSFVVVLVCAACGPSSQQIADAKSARYRGDRSELYAIAKQVAAEDYKIGEEDGAGFVFATRPQWYSAEGGRQSVGAGDLVQISAGSVQLSLVVQISELESGWLVVITPHTLQYLSGSPKPRELTPDDPNLPPWIPGRVDSLAIAIHERAKGMQIK